MTFHINNHEICEGGGDWGQDDGQTSSSFHKITDDWSFVWEQIKTQKQQKEEKKLNESEKQFFVLLMEKKIGFCFFTSVLFMLSFSIIT
jgi:hypothetical protein